MSLETVVTQNRAFIGECTRRLNEMRKDLDHHQHVEIPTLIQRITTIEELLREQRSNRLWLIGLIVASLLQLVATFV